MTNIIPLWKQKLDAGEIDLSGVEKTYFRKIVDREPGVSVAKQVRQLTSELVGGGYIGKEVYSCVMDSNSFNLFLIKEVVGFEAVEKNIFNECFNITEEVEEVE